MSTSRFRDVHRLGTQLRQNYLEEDTKIEKEKKDWKTKIQENWLSGTTVGLVNLPLCISLAIASGCSPEMGLISGIFAGLSTGFWGGSHYNIVGPTGALSGFLFLCVARYGIENIPLFSLATSLIILAVRYFEIENYIDLFPSTVNEGFTLGVASIIFLGQVNSALGIGPLPKDPREEDATTIHTLIKNLININLFKPYVFMLFLTMFFALYTAIKKFPKVPWMIFSAIIGIFIGLNFPDTFPTIESRYKLEFTLFILPKFNLLLLIDPRFYSDCLPIIFVVVLETLISAKIADSMTKTKFKFNKKKEMFSLSLANLLSGFFGGIPVTAALARTALNINSGATHKWSSLINSFCLLLLGSLFFGYFKYVPLCIVASQVCVLAFRMVNLNELEILYKKEQKNFFVLLFIGFICVFKDPTSGIVLGMLVYLLFFTEKMINPWCDIFFVEIEKQLMEATGVPRGAMSDVPNEPGSYVVYRFVGIFNFMNIDQHYSNINKLIKKKKEEQTLVLSFLYLHQVDYEALHCINELVLELKKHYFKDKLGINKHLRISITKSKFDIIKDNDFFHKLNEDKLIYEQEKDLKKEVEVDEFGINKIKIN